MLGSLLVEFSEVELNYEKKTQRIANAMISRDIPGKTPTMEDEKLLTSSSLPSKM